MPRTRIIAGLRLTLETGVRYRASRPMASRGRRDYPVTIDRLERWPVPVTRIDGLTYEQANRLVNGFNDGAFSFDGRVW